MPKNKPNHITAFIKCVLQPEKLQSEGKNYAVHELVPEAIQRFSELSKEQKDYYKEIAKGYRGVDVTKQFFQPPKRASEVVPTAFAVTNLAEESRKNELKAKAVHDRIRRFSSKKELIEKEFVSIAMQYFLDFEPHIRPVEIALVKWSMGKGVIDCFSELINPGEIPLGLRYTLKEYAESTHQVTEEKYSSGTDDYGGLWSRILSFISRKDRLEPVYCFAQSSNLVSTCLDWINARTSTTRLEISVNPLEHLFRELLLFAETDIEINVLRNFLSQYNFDLSRTLRCPFHGNLLCECCALAHAKKPVYNMLSSLSSVYNFQLTENHEQVNEDILSTSILPENWPSRPGLPGLNRVKTQNEDEIVGEEMEVETAGGDLKEFLKMEDEDFDSSMFGAVGNLPPLLSPLGRGRAIRLHQNLQPDIMPGRTEDGDKPAMGRGRAFLFKGGTKDVWDSQGC